MNPVAHPQPHRSAQEPDPDLRHALLQALALEDSAAEPALDGLTAAAAAAAGCPIAAFVVFDGGPLKIKSWHGPHRSDAADHAAHFRQVMQAAALVEVSVFGPALRYCAGSPLRVEGLVVGALCVADTQPRPALDATARAALAGLVVVGEALLSARRPGAESDARALRRRQELLSRISHEMRTPLNAMLGFAQLLRLTPALASDDRANGWVAQIETAAERLLSMVQEMLVLARLEAQRHPAPLHRADLAEVLHGCLALLAPLAGAQGVRLVLQGEHERAYWPVSANERALRQILVNLIDNAIRHSPRGAEVVVVLQALGLRLGVAITDQGPGIAPDELARLWAASGPDELSAASSATSSAASLSGRGLAISRRLAAALHGVIDVHSAPGAGSTFRLQLPAAAAVAA